MAFSLSWGSAVIVFGPLVIFWDTLDVNFRDFASLERKKSRLHFWINIYLISLQVPNLECRPVAQKIQRWFIIGNSGPLVGGEQITTLMS